MTSIKIDLEEKIKDLINSDLNKIYVAELK